MVEKVIMAEEIGIEVRELKKQNKKVTDSIIKVLKGEGRDKEEDKNEV